MKANRGQTHHLFSAASSAASRTATGSTRRPAAALRWAIIALTGVVMTGCRLDMHIQPKYKGLEPSSFFNDGRSERPAVPGTVARGELRTDELYYTGKINGQIANVFPFPIT